MPTRLLLVLTLIVAMTVTLLGVPFDPPPAAATGASEPVVLVVDTSGSMAGTRLTQAKDALRASVGALDDGRPAGLRSYAGSCSNGGILRVPVGVDNREALLAETDTLVASGLTPTPAALRAAADDLPDGTGTVVLISDGQSTCGDPCPAAEQLAEERGIDFTVHTVGFFAPDQAESELSCIAEATGGTYVPATDTDSLERAINDAVGGPGLGRFVVLGDSYSSGEGAGSYTVESGDCHRSTGSWAEELARISGGELVANLACSGAELRHVTQTPYASNGVRSTQLDMLADIVQAGDETRGEQVDTILFTIGGNDLGFADILEACYLDGATRGFLRPNVRAYRDAACLQQPAMRDPGRQLDSLIRGIAGELYPLLKVVSPDTQYVLVGYPRIFPHRYEDITKCGWLQEDAHERINRLSIDLTLRGFWLAEDSPDDLAFVGSLGVHEGRELCVDDSYYFPIVSGKPWDQQQGHPTELGQTSWAEWILADLRRQGLA